MSVLAAALAVYGVFLLVTAPARLVRADLARHMPPGLVLTRVRGSIWSGRLTLHADHGPVLSRVRFTFSPAVLLQGRLGYTLSLTGPVHGDARIALGARSLLVSDARIAAPVAPLAQTWAALRGLGVGGGLQLAASRLALGRRLRGHGQLTWSRLTLVSAPVNPLGDYRARFVLQGRGLRFRLRTLAGRLRVRGQGRYDAGELTFRGDVKGRGLRMGPLVDRFGTPDGALGRRVVFHIPL